MVKDARPTRIDALCLVLITFLSAAPYVSRLGFYSDDWNFLVSFRLDEIDGRFGLMSILTNESFRARPLQGLYLAGLYKIFGLHPLGHHLVNTAVLACSIALFHSLLLRMKFSRASGFLATLILIVLPQLSTVRVWYSTFQIPLGMALALGSMHLQLTYLQSRRPKWAAAALAVAVLSVAAYEIFAPLLLAFALAVAWLAGRDRADGRGERPRRWLQIGILAAIVGAAVIAKSALSGRVKAPDFDVYWKGLIQLVRPDYDWRVDYSLNVFASTSVNLWHPIVGWAKAATGVAGPQAMPAAFITAIAAAALGFWRLRSRSVRPSARDAGRMLAMGVAAFVLGHATFLLVPDIMFSPSGMANRALTAAAPGVALIFAAILLFACRLAGIKGAEWLLAACGALVAFLGVYRVNQIASYWAAVPAIQAKVLKAAQADLQALPRGATVILDGVCPYYGPAVVFESGPDVTGALSLTLDGWVRGDAVSNRASLGSGGISTSIYGESSTYPFGHGLFIYDPRRRLVTPVNDESVAHRYFADPGRPPLTCPEGYVGQGVLI